MAVTSARRVCQILTDRLDDFQRHLQRVQLVFDRHHTWSLVGRAVQQMADFEFEGIILMDENPFDQGFLLITEFAAPKSVLGSALPIDANILIGVIQQDVLPALRDR
jgi:hypothetical protein